MNEAQFIERREPDWKALVLLCDRADASTAFLESHDFHELIRAYRRVSADLAYARTQGVNEQMTTFLNDIVGRAYAQIYRAPRKPFWAAIAGALAVAARAGRRRKWCIFVSVGIFLVSSLMVFTLMQVAPASHDVFISPGTEQENVDAWKQGLPPRSGEQSSMAAGFYATNNPKVAVVATSMTVVTFGAFGVYILYETGAEIGALAHEMKGVGKLGLLLSWLTPHGVSEISGMFVSTGAGFALAWALIKPGRRPRREALREAGEDGIALVTMSVIMMFIAAPFEGYFSFDPRIPIPVKLTVAAVIACGWAAFWIGYGRTEDEAILVAKPREASGLS